MRSDICAWLVAGCLVAAGCSSNEPSTGPMGSGGASGSGGTTGGSGGSTPGSGGSGGAMEGSGGSVGSGGMTAPGSGGEMMMDAPIADAAGSGGAVGTDGGGGGNFTCTLILGAGQTLQWYNGGGFEAAVGNAKWEIKATDNTFTEAWASANSAFWNLATQSPCATAPTMPDRVLLIVYSHTLTTQADWETQLGMAVTNIKTKYPSAQRIELLSFARGPGNMMCGTAAASTTSAAQDMAMQAVADRSAGMVKVGPKYFVPTCAAFAVANNTNLTTAGAMAIAQMLSAVYK